MEKVGQLTQIYLYYARLVSFHAIIIIKEQKSYYTGKMVQTRKEEKPITCLNFQMSFYFTNFLTPIQMP